MLPGLTKSTFCGRQSGRQKKRRISLRLVNIDRDLVLIPNLAIHMDRTANDGYKYNIQKDLLPLYGTVTAKGTFFQQIADAAGVTPAEILGHDLFLYNRQEGTIWGADNEFISAGRLDDLQCAFASLKGFLQGKKELPRCPLCTGQRGSRKSDETRRGFYLSL